MLLTAVFADDCHNNDFGQYNHKTITGHIQNKRKTEN